MCAAMKLNRTYGVPSNHLTIYGEQNAHSVNYQETVHYQEVPRSGGSREFLVLVCYRVSENNHKVFSICLFCLVLSVLSSDFFFSRSQGDYCSPSHNIYMQPQPVKKRPQHPVNAIQRSDKLFKNKKLKATVILSTITKIRISLEA